MKLLFFCLWVSFLSFSQDTLFIKNEIASRENIIESIKIDSMLININGEKIKSFLEDSSFTLLSNVNDESSIYEVKSFYFVLNGNIINDTLSYLFDLYLDNKHFQVYLPGNYMLKGRSNYSRLFINTYKAKKNLKFWKRKFYGFSFGTYVCISSHMHPIKAKFNKKNQDLKMVQTLQKE